MNILEAINKVGLDAVEVQEIVKCITKAETIDDRYGTITFGTTEGIVSDLNRCLIHGGTPKKLGLVLWIDTETLLKTVRGSKKRRLRNPPKNHPKKF